ncbi:MAG: hypothetical protein F6K39_03765, partial [Okeania sp. SIO3B3]|nr:hypothetical protein [Okeania sp. SIO3B3]
ASPTHTHLDQGSFILQMDDQEVFIDRGMIQYHYSDHDIMKKSFLHNVATPISPTGSYLDQLIPQQATIPHGTQAGNTFEGGIDLTPVWEHLAANASRSFSSPDADTLIIRDKIILFDPAPMAFHLHSPHPMDVREDGIYLQAGEVLVRIQSQWHTKCSAKPYSVDLDHRPIWHLALHSPACVSHTYETTISRV